MKPESKTTNLLDKCDVVGCDQEWDISVGAEKLCLHHAEERGDIEYARLPNAKN